MLLFSSRYESTSLTASHDLKWTQTLLVCFIPIPRQTYLYITNHDLFYLDLQLILHQDLDFSDNDFLSQCLRLLLSDLKHLDTLSQSFVKCAF